MSQSDPDSTPTTGAEEFPGAEALRGGRKRRTRPKPQGRHQTTTPTTTDAGSENTIISPSNTPNGAGDHTHAGTHAGAGDHTHAGTHAGAGAGTESGSTEPTPVGVDWAELQSVDTAGGAWAAAYKTLAQRQEKLCAQIRQKRNQGATPSQIQHLINRIAFKTGRDPSELPVDFFRAAGIPPQ